MDGPADGPSFGELDFGNSDEAAPEIEGEKASSVLDPVYLFFSS